jgi:hypothetical protein
MIRSGLVAFIMLGAAAAQAAPECFSANEMEAEQAMRYQAKLMVLSDTCRSDAYGLFLRKNGELIASYQHEMIGHYRRVSASRAETAFDTYLTRLANEFALGAGQQPLPSLCANSADFLTKAPTYGRDEFRHYVAAQAAEERQGYRVCGEPQRQALDR